MTLPDQPGGTSLDFSLLTDLFGVTGDGGIPFMSELTQPFVEIFLKGQVQGDSGWLGASAAAFTGLIPGVALVPNILMNIATTIIGLPFGTWPGTGPGGFLGEIPNIFADMGNFFTNLTGIFGTGVDFNSLLFDIPAAVFNFVDTMLIPTDLIASLIGGFIPGLQIPGLDASKIVSGTFGFGLLQPLIDSISTGFGGSSGLNFGTLTTFLAGLPFIQELLDVLANALGNSGTGFSLPDIGNIFTDLFGLFGSPTDLGTGTPVLPGISSIPVLGGLLSGGNILTSIIPGLDVSKIVSGVFGTGFIPGLDVAKIISGVFGAGFIPGLDASKITTGLFGTGLIPGLDVSKIVSGVFGTGFIPSLDVAKITTGIFGAGFIPGLDASKIITGLFGSGLIPGLDITKIVSGDSSGVTGFINSILDIPKLVFTQPLLDSSPQGSFPYTFPITFGELTAEPMELLVQNLSRLLTGTTGGGDLVSPLFTLPTAALNFIQGILLPQNAIASLDPVTGLVPDTQSPQVVQDIIDNGFNAVDSGIIGNIIGNPVGTFFDVISSIFGGAANAQSVNVIQNAQLDAISSGGTGIFDTFDGAQITDLGAAVTQRYTGAGSGTCGRDGSGNAEWTVSGASVRECNNSYAALTTDTQKVSLILNSNPASVTTTPIVKLQVRQNVGATECVEARIGRDGTGPTCEIGYVLADTYTRFGAVRQFTGDSNGTWELKAGTTASNRQFLLYRNGSEMVDRTDAGALSAMGASNRRPAWSHVAGVNFFWIFYQVAPPKIASFSASDRTADS